MDFVQAREECEQWIKDSGTSFQLLDCDSEERKFVFSNQSLSFYIFIPDTEDSKWNVWSENDIVVTQMENIQNYVQSCKSKTLTDILNFMDNTLKPLMGAAGGEGGAVGGAAAPVGGGRDDEDSGDEGSDEIEEDLDEGDDINQDDTEDLDDGYAEEYYDGMDMDAMDSNIKQENIDEDIGDAERFFTGKASPITINRLLKDFRGLDHSKGKYGVLGMPRGDNLLTWDVKLTDFPSDTPLGKDLSAFARNHNREPVIYMEMEFPPDYPMAPPFVRVVRPRFRFLTGHITIGGSICMELLTKSGWSPSNDIESILVQVRSEIMADNEARLDSNPDREYGRQEAQQAFDRMVTKYGWNK